jgi:hypothetical protein
MTRISHIAEFNHSISPVLKPSLLEAMIGLYILDGVRFVRENKKE